ncbi:MAG: hypothetical protein A2144_04465 [Chloroflexi bacterium RBG_16_50_9]|nr:MAG: hypothetical protein A2144_04465 [Chloroflexi bacterium RBG_16_50_9]
MKNQNGSSFIEAAVALALLGIIGVTFLGAMATSSTTRTIADEHATSRILAESQMEEVKKQTYAFSYNPITVPPEFDGYYAIIDVDNMRNGNIQKISITIRHHNKEITTLESYKVNQ